VTQSIHSINHTNTPQRGLHGQVVRSIGLRIVRGDFPTGLVIPSEEMLSTELGVSRTIIREDIKVLAGKGLVESRPKIGTRVQPRTAWSLLDSDVLAWQYEAGFNEQFVRNLIEMRLMVEMTVVELAATRATDEEVDRIDRAYRGMQMGIADHDSFITADLEFHSAILAASHNELIQQMSGTIVAALLTSFRLSVRLGATEESVMFHGAILAAIRRRDPGGARAAMQALVNRTAAEIEQAIRLP
jgi:GntR family galactonate operon transcriptional repressor